MKKEFDWFDKPQNIKKLKIISIAVLVIIVISEFFIHAHKVNVWDKIPGINAIFGLVFGLVLIVVSKLLGKFWLKKDEDYYDK